jgi:hypothetical protein
MTQDYKEPATSALKLLSKYEKILEAQERGQPTIEVAGLPVLVEDALAQFKCKFPVYYAELEGTTAHVLLQRILRYAEKRESDALNGREKEVKEDTDKIKAEIPNARSKLEALLK